MSTLTCFFFFNDTATTEIYTLSLHDALPISNLWSNYTESFGIVNYSIAAKLGYDAMNRNGKMRNGLFADNSYGKSCRRDRKSTRLNSSHANISYAVFCLKKKKNELNYFLTIP